VGEALYRKNFSGKREELIPGIENMQILYGVCADSNRDTLIYYKAAQVPNWSQVCSVDVDLLINSIDSVLLKPENYLFQGESMTATDRLLHKNWETYIALRET